MTPDELDRLAGNQRNLLEAIPEMVLLINIKGKIEHMNPSAITFFGELCSPASEQNLRADQLYNQLIKMVETALEQKTSEIAVTLINGSHLQYCIAPFSGYDGDNLHWLIIRDITENTRYKEELKRHNKNIESILSHRIDKLKENQFIRKKLAKQLKNIKSRLELQPSTGTMIGSCKAMQDIKDMVLRVANSHATILITGESGTGKELVANLIRETSDRKDKPFHIVNCNTINTSLLESDLFGHEKGSFTGAHRQKKGKFEIVNGGTILLDEIGDTSPRMQAALLRVLQNGEIFRVGGNSPIKVDVRIMAATNVDLAAAVQEGTFRLDLFYRLNIINVAIPPLRERKEDIIDLVNHFINTYKKAYKKDVEFVPELIMDKLLNHSWPGNIRELDNVVQRAILMNKTLLNTDNDLALGIPVYNDDFGSVTSVINKFGDTPLKGIMVEIEKRIIVQKLGADHFNVAKVAKKLDISKAALYEKMKRYKISTKQLR